MKKVNPFILFLFVIVALSFSCSSENSFNEKISGKWKMVKLLELSEDVTQIHNPDNNRWISFKANPDSTYKGTFESGTGEEKENTGKWFYDERTNEFFLDSDAGEEDDSYWEVSFTAHTMFWKGKNLSLTSSLKSSIKKLTQKDKIISLTIIEVQEAHNCS